MVAVGIAASVLAIVAAILFAVNRSSAPGWVQAMEVTALVSPIIIAVFIRYNYRKEVVNAVEVSEQQYPELHAVFREHPQATHRLASALTQRAAPVCGDRWRPGDHPG